MAEEHEIVADIHELIDELIAETEEELGRDLDDDERDSIIDEFLAGLDDDEPIAASALAANEESDLRRKVRARFFGG